MLHCLELYIIHFILTSYIQHNITHKNWYYITVSSQQSFRKAKITNIFSKRSFAFGTCATLKEKKSILYWRTTAIENTKHSGFIADRIRLVLTYISSFSSQKLNLHYCFISTKLLQSKDNEKLYIRHLLYTKISQRAVRLSKTYSNRNF